MPKTKQESSLPAGLVYKIREGILGLSEDCRVYFILSGGFKQKNGCFIYKRLCYSKKSGGRFYIGSIFEYPEEFKEKLLKGKYVLLSPKEFEQFLSIQPDIGGLVRTTPELEAIVAEAFNEYN